MDLLKHSVPEDVVGLCRRLADAGFRSWVVGGCVRDLLLAQRTTDSKSGGAGAAAEVRNDWDLATDAMPEQVQKLFRKVIPTGIKHGTVTVMLRGVGYEVTTLRGETTYSDGRRPDQVYFVDDIRADLARRDFTVNAIAYDPLADQLIDPFGGATDLENNLLRAVGVASERFGEDGLRVLRAARFVATLGMRLEPETADAIRPSLDTYRKVSPERIRDEWIKTLAAPKPSPAFQIMLDHGIMQATAPQLAACAAQTSRHSGSEHSIWTHQLRVLDACPADPILRTAALLHDVGETRPAAGSSTSLHAREGAAVADAICTQLRYSNAERERICALVRHHAIDHEALSQAPALRRWLRQVGADVLPQLWQLAAADCAVTADHAGANQLEELQSRVDELLANGVVLSTKQLALGGRELMQQLGLAPGKHLGVLLDRLLERVTDHPELNTPERLLSEARALIADQS